VGEKREVKKELDVTSGDVKSSPCSGNFGHEEQGTPRGVSHRGDALNSGGWTPERLPSLGGQGFLILFASSVSGEEMLFFNSAQCGARRHGSLIVPNLCVFAA
jgi:hypothetical protein